VDSAILSDVSSAPEDIDRVLSACIFHQQPCYISLPVNMVNQECPSPRGKLMIPERKSEDSVLREALDDCVAMINAAKKPVILADVEIIRYKLQKEFLQLAEKSGFPVSVLMMGKGAINEDHPQFIGLYQGDRSRQYVRHRVEDADCVISFGMCMTDINTGGFTMHLDRQKWIDATVSRVRIKNHYYENVSLKDFINELSKRMEPRRDPSTLDITPAFNAAPHRYSAKFEPKPDARMTFSRFFDRMSHFMPENSIVIVDTGTAMYGAMETLLKKGSSLIGQVYYGSIGYTVGATLGACIAAQGTNSTVIWFIGDGAFQVTCQDLSTMIRYNLNPWVFLINNDGYTIERAIVDGVFNDIPRWSYHNLPEVFGGRQGHEVKTEGDLEKLLSSKKKESKDLEFVEVVLDRMDYSENLAKTAKFWAKMNCCEVPKK